MYPHTKTASVLIKISKMKCALSWYSSLPIQSLGFALHKDVFKDAVYIHYGWTPPNLPIKCVCGRNFSLDHTFSCTFGVFPTMLFVILQRLIFPVFAMMLPLNPTYNIFLVNCYNIGLLMFQMKFASI